MRSMQVLEIRYAVKSLKDLALTMRLGFFLFPFSSLEGLVLWNKRFGLPWLASTVSSTTLMGGKRDVSFSRYMRVEIKGIISSYCN
jgi:hypothetical protein